MKYAVTGATGKFGQTVIKVLSILNTVIIICKLQVIMDARKALLLLAL
ncbi:hypothetical protein LSA_2p00150 (plasmid) [Fructilactobacillus sanfranciscensis TMW 1.1304]|uniref:Uncharacterized protein n=1 Tax=Fructilactobacillus sanfranciscensis (strain TMW 1.1304) TaxID=714313 RepID=G2KWS2_FRUST|nr:hypothetical protein LSA_2p00150 [Fructilactobacillus sanfranciscensis TMW 1.1304]